LKRFPGSGPSRRIVCCRLFTTRIGYLGASVTQLATLVGPALARAIAMPPDAARCCNRGWIGWLSRNNRLLTWNDPAIRRACGICRFRRPGLYVKGDPAWLARPMLAIVGSRHASPQGLRDAEAFARACRMPV
jgi:DNA processing protein